MKQQSKLSQEQQNAETQQTRQPAGRDFASVDEMIRFDAAQTVVPQEIAERLKKSTDAEPAADRTWWRRIFGAYL
jgi:hypothetical protein